MHLALLFPYFFITIHNSFRRNLLLLKFFNERQMKIIELMVLLHNMSKRYYGRKDYSEIYSSKFILLYLYICKPSLDSANDEIVWIFS